MYLPVGGNINKAVVATYGLEGYEKVYSYDWYDGPRSGVANFNGRPYYFESQWEDTNTDESDSFKLCPISNDLLAVVVEQWRLWKRYEEAFYQGLATQDSHPFLPADKLEGQRLNQILRNELKFDGANYLIAKAEFVVDKVQAFELGMRDLVVKWEVIDKE